MNRRAVSTTQLRHLTMLFAAVAIFLTPSLLSAQAQATTGVLRGTTTDSTGRPISAFVTIRNTETNFTRTIKSTDQGIFVATLVPLGNYQVSARAVGYVPDNKSNIIVNVGQTVEVPLRMARAVTTLAGVTVLGETVVEATKTAEATRLPAAVVSALPNNGRNYLNLTFLTSNVEVNQGPAGDVYCVVGQLGIHNRDLVVCAGL